MDKIFELLEQFGVTLTDEQSARIKDAAPVSDDASSDAEKALAEQLAEVTEKYRRATEQLAARERGYAVEKLFSEYKFASERVRNSVLGEFASREFPLENGEFIGGREYLEELKRSEPDVFAKENTGLFMDSTRGNVAADENDLEFQIFGGFGLKK